MPPAPADCTVTGDAVLQLNKGDMREIISGVGMTAGLILLSILLPVIGFFFALFVPLPVLLYRSKLGRPSGNMVAMASMLIAAAMVGNLGVDLLFFLELLLIGMMLSELFEKNLSIGQTIGLVCAGVVATTLAALVFYGQLSQQGLIGMVSAYVARNVELTMALYESMGVSEANIDIIRESLEHIKYVLVRITPSLMVMGILFVTWVNVLVARPVFRVRAVPYPDFGVLNHWRAPEPLVWAVIACGAALVLGQQSIKIIALNGLLVLMTVYFFQGIAIVAFFFEKKKMPRLLRVFLYSLIGMQQLVLLIVIALGFFDMWLNFRKLDKSSGGNNESHPARDD